MHDTSLHIATQPYTILRLDGAAHRIITPMLDTNGDAMHTVLHIESANMAVPVWRRRFRQLRPCKALQPLQSAICVLQTGSRPSVSLFLFTEASDHGSRVFGESFAGPQRNNSLAHDVHREHSHHASTACDKARGCFWAFCLVMAYRYQSRYHQS